MKVNALVNVKEEKLTNSNIEAWENVIKALQEAPPFGVCNRVKMIKDLEQEVDNEKYKIVKNIITNHLNEIGIGKIE